MNNQYEYCNRCPDFGAVDCELRRDLALIELATDQPKAPSRLKKIGTALLFCLGSAYSTPSASAYQEYRNVMDAKARSQAPALPEIPSPQVEDCVRRHVLKQAG